MQGTARRGDQEGLGQVAAVGCLLQDSADGRTKWLAAMWFPAEFDTVGRSVFPIAWKAQAVDFPGVLPRIRARLQLWRTSPDQVVGKGTAGGG